MLSALFASAATLSRRSVLAGSGAIALPHLAQAAEADGPDEGTRAVVGDGYSLRVPSSYYSAKGGRAQVADLVFVAADYPAGKTAAVTRTRADRLVLESGDPTAYESGSLSRLRELGKPSYVASLLVRRRDGDPRGEIAQPRSQLVWAEAVSDEELRFELRETLFTASSQTSAVPTSRSVQARAIFVPPDEGAGTAGFLLTAWASSPSSEAQALCEPVPCLLEGASLGFECPAPRCKTPGTAPPPRDAADVAVVESLTPIAVVSVSLQQSLRGRLQPAS
mmetsp:Transcript_9079/g.29684  ORF Transcript_9079/g.29684 Transcript_9079/m.29684 type:complete len:279 (+) Transcript_9079:103-939(+)